MTTYYADFDLGTGDNDGGGDGADRNNPTQAANWTNAWKTMADAIAGTNGTAPEAGDTVYCRGTDTLAATCTNAIAGNETSGLLKWIGVNSSGENDGTRAVLDKNGNAIYALTLNGGFNLYENFRFTDSAVSKGAEDGVGGTGDNFAFINCSFDNNGQHGIIHSGMVMGNFIRCTFYDNTQSGWAGTGTSHRVLFCSSHDNGYSGFDLMYSTASCFFGCLSYDNGEDGFKDVFAYQILINCVADGNTDDAVAIRSADTAYISSVIGCRITNQSGAGDIGLNANTEIILYGWNYISNNADTIASNTLAYAITNNGATTNSLSADGASVGDTLEGYTDDDPKDFNLASDATLRRTAITIPTS